MEACGRQLFTLKALLNSFASSTGLRVNFSKSMMIPINLNAQNLITWPQLLAARLEVFPLLTLDFHLASPSQEWMIFFLWLQGVRGG
jgi:hypothetical protein